MKALSLPFWSRIFQKNNYSKEFKEITIKRVLINKESICSVAIDIGLSSDGTLHDWIKKYKENCYNVIEKKKERPEKTMTKIKKSKKILTKEDKIKELEDKILYLEAENEYLKKIRSSNSGKRTKQKGKIYNYV